MIWEVALLEIKTGQEAAFENALTAAVPLFKDARGCHGMQIQKSIENPGRYRLIVDWETLEDHTVHFRQSEAFGRWRGLVGEYFASAPVVEHTRKLSVGF